MSGGTGGEGARAASRFATEPNAKSSWKMAASGAVGILSTLLSMVATAPMALTASPVPTTPRPPALGPPELQSTLRAGAREILVRHRPPASRFLPPPDLSRAQTLSLPRSAWLESPVDLLGEGAAIAAGCYRLGLAVDERGDPHLTLSAGGSLPAVRWPLELGQYDAPGEGVRVFLLGVAQTRGAADDGAPRSGIRCALQVRWGSLLLQASFRPLIRTRQLVEGWRLEAAVYPDDVPSPLGAAPLGRLAATEGGPAPRELFFTADERGGELLAVDAERLRLEADSEAIERQLRRLAREETDAETDAAGEGIERARAARRESLRRRLAGLAERVAARRRAVPDRRLRAAQEMPAGIAFGARLVAVAGSSALLRVTSPAGSYDYPLDALAGARLPLRP